MKKLEDVESGQMWQSGATDLMVTIIENKDGRVAYKYLDGTEGEISIHLFRTYFERV